VFSVGNRPLGTLGESKVKVNLSLCLAYGGVDILIHIFLTSELVVGEWSASRLGHFTPGERAPGTYWVGGWVSRRADLDDVKTKFLTLLGFELRPLSRPARSQSVYGLHYPGY
jgi:hypothetical protein